MKSAPLRKVNYNVALQNAGRYKEKGIFKERRSQLRISTSRKNYEIHQLYQLPIFYVGG